MASWKNPIINTRQYANYGFNMENVKPKKIITASGLNPVNKTIKRDSGSESKAQSTTRVEEVPVVEEERPKKEIGLYMQSLRVA